MEIDVSSAKKVSTREWHCATAHVGKDIIEAEYIIFEHSDLLEPRKMSWFEKAWDAITTPYYKAKWKFDRAYWNCRYGFERMFKGYDSVDTFEIFSKFIERYTKILTELRNCHYGYPYDLTEEEWDNVLDEMIYHLYYMDEEHVIEELERDVPDDWSVSQKIVGEVMNKHKNAFFELFSKYFFSLWD